MLSFFRKIRKKILADNKFSKYILYAIGEIVLIVLGILIALSINNWNESKKNRAQEIVLLNNLKQDLIRDTIDIKEGIVLFNSFYREERKLLNFLYHNDNEPETPIDYNLALSTPTIALIHQSSFKNLQSNDPRLLTNNTLRKKITRHYDFFAEMVIALEDETDAYDTYSMKLPYFLKYFNAVNKPDILLNSEQNSDEYINPDIIRNDLQIKDLAGLRKDEEFKIVLSESLSFLQAKMQLFNNLMIHTLELIEAIDMEIEELRM